MEEEKRTNYTIIAIAALLGLLFTCILGVLVGGAAGFVAGQRQGRMAAERALEGGLGGLPGLLVPEPEQEVQPCPGCDSGEEGQVLPPGMMRQGRQGALIQEVIPGSPAEDAGLEPGDMIVAVDRTPVNRAYPLADVIGQYKPGDQVTIHFWRGDQQDAVQVELGENSDAPGQAYLGVRYGMTGFPTPGD